MLSRGRSKSTVDRPVPGSLREGPRAREPRERIVYPSEYAAQLSTLLRTSADLDIVGDVSVTVSGPSELLAWADTLPEPAIVAWRAHDAAGRYVQVTAPHNRNPVHGRVTAVLGCEQHRPFWDALVAGTDLEPGQQRALRPQELSRAWAAMPLWPPEETAVHPQPPGKGRADPGA